MQWAVLRLDIDAAWDEGEVMRGGREGGREGGAGGGSETAGGGERGRDRVSQWCERRVDVVRGVTETLGKRQEEEHTGRWTHTKRTIQHFCVEKH